MMESSPRETALSWLQRVRINKRRLTQNPIVFANNESNTDHQDSHTEESDQFQVNTVNMIQLAHETFTNNTVNLLDIQMRLERYKRTKHLPLHLESNLLSSFSIGTQIDFLNGNVEIQSKLPSVATELLMILVANYAASTSVSCLKLQESQSGGGHVYILDPEYRFHPFQLENYIRIAVYKRWNQSEPFRKEYLNEYSSIEEERDIEKDIQGILHRIHILHPSNIHQDGIALLEQIEEPCMIVMNDLSSFQNVNRMYESLGKGLSGVHDFIRQLKRLNSDKVCVVGARYITGDMDLDSSHTLSYYQDGLEKLMTQSVAIMETLVDSPEYHEGYDYVALNVKSLHSNSDTDASGSMTNRRMENLVQGKMYPFSITSNGVKCKVGL
ncbi:predicted protein [Chaetoceros tenuissimus]|uniref:Uncharacterized protein n=1 Tax=Chaetoceros tenuissimus TaxID=426638 RepID=A0AAD3CIC0_9STRA|nr:predicted protein [Chaetoceros tenuissimus]